jgi:hypothetical protein
MNDLIICGNALILSRFIIFEYFCTTVYFMLVWQKYTVQGKCCKKDNGDFQNFSTLCGTIYNIRNNDLSLYRKLLRKLPIANMHWPNLPPPPLIKRHQYRSAATVQAWRHSDGRFQATVGAFTDMPVVI